MHHLNLLVLLGITIVMSFGISELMSALDSAPHGLERAIKRKLRSPEFWPIMDEQVENIFWIVQISDIHISLFRDLARAPDLIRLCDEYLRLINPEAVIVTGDLTDAKMKDSIDTIQFKDEWITYQNVVEKCSAMIKRQWVDIRGNHDCFDVTDFSSKNNFYRKFSATGPFHTQKEKFEHGFIHNIVRKDGSLYSFVGMDTCSRPGPNRPFNFFGYMNEKQSQHLKYLSALTAVSNHTVWFGHYPTSLIVHNPPVIRDIMRGSIMYLCGHLHTLGNLVPRMYAKHKTGQLELELGDWKDNRLFRVIAFDHDLVSFTDAKLGQWPIILITNPKNNQFLSPSLEPVEMISFSTHIRILIFSHIEIQHVSVHIDGVFQGKARQAKSENPLYVLEWNPKQFAKGTHEITVTVVTKDKNTAFVRQYFSVEGQEQGFSLLPRLLLMLNIYTVGKGLFGLMVFAYVTTCTILSQCSNIRPYLLQGRYWPHHFLNRMIGKTWLISKTTSLLYLLVGSVLYMAFGPWFVGYLLTDHVGVVFAWGIIVNGTFIPGGHTYIYAIFQFLTFTIPLTLIVGHILDQRRRHNDTIPLRKHILFALLTLLLYCFLIFLACGEFVRAYGKMAFLLGPLRTGNLILLPLAVRLALKADVKISSISSTF